MGLNCGIVGLPNVGKSTIFQALTSAPAEAANYPFCTIDPNVGIVNVPDERLNKIAKFIPTEKIIPAICEFVDIAGLVKGASKGEGLGNKFLANIRETSLILHVVRCFEDSDIIHVSNKVDPASDIETINIELMLSDLETVEKRLDKNIKLAKAKDTPQGKIANLQIPILEKIKDSLSNYFPARIVDLSEDELSLIKDLNLLTMKKVLYVCNVDENNILTDNDFVKEVAKIAKKENTEYVKICGKIESEISNLEDENDKHEFLNALGLATSGLNILIQKSFYLLNYRTFFTAGPKEVRAWTFNLGDKAPKAASVIHTDFEKGFIKAEIYSCEDLFELKSEIAVKQSGKLRIEGKDYIVKDGDVIFFKFNV